MLNLDTNGKKKLSRARHYSLLRSLGIALMDKLMLSGIVSKLSYRCGLHGRLAVTSLEIPLNGHLHLSTPLVLAFASDFHAGPTTHPAIFNDLVTALQPFNPHLFLLGGDFVSCKATYVDALLECLSQINPAHGKYAVLGNHDLWTDEEYITDKLHSHGIHVLINQHVRLATPYENVSICGIDDPWTGSPEIKQSFMNTNPVRIFLSHSPDGLLFIENETFALGLSGHTHGGQIALPNGTPLIAGSGPLSRRYSRGIFHHPAGPFIVSRGVGCSNLPVRINSAPELIICKLFSPGT